MEWTHTLAPASQYLSEVDFHFWPNLAFLGGRGSTFSARK